MDYLVGWSFGYRNTSNRRCQHNCEWPLGPSYPALEANILQHSTLTNLVGHGRARLLMEAKQDSGGQELLE